ncbi:GNAT family N-acetyltransferase [Gorillibacterium massiliense]|uniref:GNAT family N-acetyltransferase n=1 Tax=Gorillibacterium massiliense TaxID=1280390 RepID=UPI000594B77F|nr:GNAT family N-acetyltransferase [Gorillibacterium massiliense]
MDEMQFREIYTLMEAAFPETELRAFDDQFALLKHARYGLRVNRSEGGELLGILAGWQFSAFRFVEHIAIHTEIRGQGIGRRMLEEYLNEAETPVVLEVELPDTPIAQRRIAFYERIGFHLNPFAYQQPPLRRGQAPLPLHIMSYPAPLTEAAFHPYKITLYREVYNISKISAD